jgi:hypothetical protein
VAIIDRTLRKQERFQVECFHGFKLENSPRSRLCAVFFARARRNPSQRVPDNIVESTNNQVNAATGETTSECATGCPINCDIKTDWHSQPVAGIILRFVMKYDYQFLHLGAAKAHHECGA